MKWGKLYFALFLCGVFTGNSEAVDSFGIVGGVNISSWATDAESQNPVSRSDLSIGGYASFKISNNAKILLEGLYSRKHGDLELTIQSAFPSPPPTVQHLTNFEYLEFPVLFQLGKTLTKKTEVFYRLNIREFHIHSN